MSQAALYRVGRADVDVSVAWPNGQGEGVVSTYALSELKQTKRKWDRRRCKSQSHVKGMADWRIRL